jgi:hypothetical protein
VKKSHLIRHRGCHCTERRWTWDGGEREWWRWVELRWCGTVTREGGQSWDDLLILVEGGNWTIQEGWPIVVLQIQCFNFGLRGETMGRNIAERWSEHSDLILAPWEENTTRHGGIATSTRGEAAPRRPKGGDDGSCANTNLTRLENKENSQNRFNCYKWMLKFKLTMS